MTEEQKLNHWAAEIDRIANELDIFSKSEHRGSLSASHALGVALGCLRAASRKVLWSVGK